MDEAAARRLVLVQAFDGADSPLWTREDAAWATRLALETAPPGAANDRLLSERARHALQRLEPRDRGVRRWLARPVWRWRWALLAAALGLVIGFAADLLDRNQVVNVLAPSAWAVVAWNVLIYLTLGLAALRHPARGDGAKGLRDTLLTWWQRSHGDGPVRVATRRWTELSAPLALLRVAALLHLAAAAVAIGLVGSMYLRGLVLDFRAGWQSTFLGASTVHQLLSTLLAPARLVTGLAMPDAAAFEAMRLTAPAQAASASAAPWIHLYGATLALTVVLPRLVLALVALARASYRSRHFSVPLDDPATLREVQRLRRQVSRVQICPYAQAPGAQAGLGLRTLLARELGDDLQMLFAPTAAVGDEEQAARQLVGDDVTLRVVLVDLAATPEDDHHGRFVRALKAEAPQLPLLLVTDESTYRRRFAELPARIDERRAAWRRWAAEHELRLRSLALEDLDTGAAGVAPAAAKPP
jgi:Protein of unknown function (DUF2868)